MEIRGDFKTFSKYVSLNVAGMIGTSVYVLADTLFVANGIGETGIAALNLALPMFSLIQGLGFMLGVGGATWYSILRAQNKQEEATKVYNHTLIFAGTLSLIIFLFGLFGSETIAQLLGANHATAEMTNTYLKVIMLFSPSFIFNNLLVAFIRNDKNPKLAMSAMLLGSLLNVVFDYIFIFPLGMGMFGAALATGATPIFSILLLSIHFKSDVNTLRFEKVKIKLAKLWRILTLGVSSFITEMSSGIVMLVFNIIILGIAGNVGVAAYGIIANIAIIAVSIFTGVAQGIQPIISHLFGLKKQTDLKRSLSYSLITILLLGTFIYLVVGLGSHEIIGFFNRDNNPVLADIANRGLLIYFVGILFAGFNMIAIACLSAVEQAGIAFRFSIIRSVLLIVPLAFVLAHFFDMTGVWLSFVLTEGITAGFILWHFYQIWNQRLDKQF